MGDRIRKRGCRRKANCVRKLVCTKRKKKGSRITVIKKKFIRVNPRVNSSISVDPASVQVNPVLSVAPFRRLCNTIRTTSTFSNLTTIAVPGVGTAVPYPSNIVVTGMTSTISRVTVTLFDITSQQSNDLDILLVGPDGATNTILMSDAGNNVIINENLTFDDNAPNTLPAVGSITSGAYKPTNNTGGAADFFPPPAPPGAAVAALSNFTGLVPNGTWSLYATDDTAGNATFIEGGWQITISTDVEECIYTPL